MASAIVPILIAFYFIKFTASSNLSVRPSIADGQTSGKTLMILFQPSICILSEDGYTLARGDTELLIGSISYQVIKLIISFNYPQNNNSQIYLADLLFFQNIKKMKGIL